MQFPNFSKGRNFYFDYRNSLYNREKELFTLWNAEVINKFGVCCEFYQTTYDVKYDPIWGEDNNRRFIKKFDIMVYYQLPREEKFFSKFGIENLDTFSMVCSKKHFSVASQNGSSEVIPKMGDIIVSKYNNNIYEITEIAEEVSIFLQSKNHIWEFVVKPYINEHIDLPINMSATTISAYTNKNDILDISNNIDINKEHVIYNLKSIEKGNDDPFANW